MLVAAPPPVAYPACSPPLPADWRYVGLAVALQWVQLMLLFFGPGFGWDIDWQGNRWEGQGAGSGRRACKPRGRCALQPPAAPAIDRSLPIVLPRPRSFWRFYTRLQLQNAITQRSYKTYEGTLFGGSALLLLLLAIVLWLHFALRTKARFRWQW